jgi:hypothetical protein
MPYCPHCGNEVDAMIDFKGPDADNNISAEVRIAEIQANRDIEVAKIAARQDRDWNETRVEVAGIEADAAVEAAVAEAEVVGAAIEAGIAPEPEPVIVNAPEAVADAEPEDAPPQVEGGSEPPEPKRKAAGLGMW